MCMYIETPAFHSQQTEFSEQKKKKEEEIIDDVKRFRHNLILSKPKCRRI